MVVVDRTGYRGYPIGYVDEGEDQWVVVRWTETSDGEARHFVTAEHIDDLEIQVTKGDKINMISKECGR